MLHVYTYIAKGGKHMFRKKQSPKPDTVITLDTNGKIFAFGSLVFMAGYTSAGIVRKYRIEQGQKNLAKVLNEEDKKKKKKTKKFRDDRADIFSL